MKRSLLFIFGVFFLSLTIAGSTYAFSMGVVDGQWSRIEYINTTTWGSATNDNWAAGPASGSTDYDSITRIFSFYYPQSDYSQGISIDDWNQVRYGVPTVTDGGFAEQSGFGFDGVDLVDDIVNPYQDVPFLLGKFCHFNNPIDPPVDPLEWVDLVIHVDNIQCDPSANSSAPFPDGILEFSYRFTLNETPNSPEGTDCLTGHAFCPFTVGSDTYCPYQTGINSLGCADKVEIGAVPTIEGFTCEYGEISTEYKINVLGLIPLSSSLDACPTTPNDEYSFSMISGEEADNCACLYGEVTEVTGTMVQLINFTGQTSVDGVLLEWETASEIDNLGFNIYRSTSFSGTKEKINENLILTELLGNPYGANYSYLDTQSLILGTYYYWLESINLSFTPSELHGPVEVLIKN